MYPEDVDYTDIRFYAESTVREFEDLKKKLKKHASFEKIEEDLRNIIDRILLFKDMEEKSSEAKIKGTREFYTRFLELKRLIELFVQKTKLEIKSKALIKKIDDFEKKMRELWKKAYKYEKKNRELEFSFV